MSLIVKDAPLDRVPLTRIEWRDSVSPSDVIVEFTPDGAYSSMVLPPICACTVGEATHIHFLTSSEVNACAAWDEFAPLLVKLCGKLTSYSIDME
jgi:hypothetical protein